MRFNFALESRLWTSLSFVSICYNKCKENEYQLQFLNKMNKAGIFLVFIMSFMMSAQTHELIKHNGETLSVNYIKLENNWVYFSKPNNSEVEKISKHAVASIINKSNGESILVSNKIMITDKNSFNQVVFIDESQTNGLTKGAYISSFYGVTKGQSEYDLNKMKKRRLQEKAASFKSPFVVILSEKPDETKAILYNY